MNGLDAFYAFIHRLSVKNDYKVGGISKEEPTQTHRVEVQPDSTVQMIRVLNFTYPFNRYSVAMQRQWKQRSPSRRCLLARRLLPSSHFGREFRYRDQRPVGKNERQAGLMCLLLSLLVGAPHVLCAHNPSVMTTHRPMLPTLGKVPSTEFVRAMPSVPSKSNMTGFSLLKGYYLLRFALLSVGSQGLTAQRKTRQRVTLKQWLKRCYQRQQRKLVIARRLKQALRRRLHRTAKGVLVNFSTSNPRKQAVLQFPLRGPKPLIAVVPNRSRYHFLPSNADDLKALNSKKSLPMNGFLAIRP